MLGWFKKKLRIVPPVWSIFPYFHLGGVSSGHMIFVRSRTYTDEELLRCLGVTDYQRVDDPVNEYPKHWVCITNDSQWTQVLDDHNDQLLYRKTTQPGIEELAKHHDVFAGFVGDVDRSYEFVYYRGGDIARKVVVESPTYSDRVTTESIGDPLPGETIVTRDTGKHNETNIILSLAASLGINVTHKRENIRVYQLPADS